MFDQDAIDTQAASTMEAMQEKLAARIQAGDELARISAYLTEIQDQYTAAYKQAIKTGWSEQELKKLGIEPLTKTAKPRTRRSPKPAPTPSEQGEQAEQ